ncbi:MAG: hypothetical protein HQL45_17785 [Alphaproteobacteria bacterium]|nr:hypothetical protein [Alphaproteobacteria bacterium]
MADTLDRRTREHIKQNEKQAKALSGRLIDDGIRHSEKSSTPHRSLWGS